MEGIPSVELFNDPKHQKLKERWCTGMFGVGYSKLVRPCAVAVNESRYREDVDFHIRVGDKEWEFQLAEVQRPGRQRGLEFRRFADGTVRSIALDPGLGAREGPAWLASAVERKRTKRYASSDKLSLVLYANFPARDLEYADVAGALLKYKGDFASLWIITSLYMGSAFTFEEIGSVPGWGPVRGIEDYYL